MGRRRRRSRGGFDGGAAGGFEDGFGGSGCRFDWGGDGRRGRSGGFRDRRESDARGFAGLQGGFDKVVVVVVVVGAALALDGVTRWVDIFGVEGEVTQGCSLG